MVCFDVLINLSIDFVFTIVLMSIVLAIDSIGFSIWVSMTLTMVFCFFTFFTLLGCFSSVFSSVFSMFVSMTMSHFATALGLIMLFCNFNKSTRSSIVSLCLLNRTPICLSPLHSRGSFNKSSTDEVAANMLNVLLNTFTNWSDLGDLM